MMTNYSSGDNLDSGSSLEEMLAKIPITETRGSLLSAITNLLRVIDISESSIMIPTLLKDKCEFDAYEMLTLAKILKASILGHEDLVKYYMNEPSNLQFDLLLAKHQQQQLMLQSKTNSLKSSSISSASITDSNLNSSSSSNRNSSSASRSTSRSCSTSSSSSSLSETTRTTDLQTASTTTNNHGATALTSRRTQQQRDQRQMVVVTSSKANKTASSSSAISSSSASSSSSPTNSTRTTTSQQQLLTTPPSLPLLLMPSNDQSIDPNNCIQFNERAPSATISLLMQVEQLKKFIPQVTGLFESIIELYKNSVEFNGA